MNTTVQQIKPGRLFTHRNCKYKVSFKSLGRDEMWSCEIVSGTLVGGSRLVSSREIQDAMGMGEVK